MPSYKRKCVFCGKEIYNLEKHHKTHKVSKSSAFLSKFYKEGDTLLDMKRKLISSKGAQKAYQKIENKDECFQQMLKDLKRIRSQIDVNSEKSQNLNTRCLSPCIFCNGTFSDVFRHYKTHGLNESSCYLLRFYKEGDNYDDVHFKILETHSRNRVIFNRIINKRKAFNKFLIEYKRLKNKFENIKNKNNDIVDEDSRIFNISEIDKQCIFCKVNVQNVFKHLKSHGIEDSSAFLLTFYDDGDSLLDIQNEINQKKGLSKRFYYKFLNEENFQQMLLDYNRIKNEFDDGNKRRTLRSSNEIILLDSDNDSIEENENKKTANNHFNMLEINKIDKPCILCKKNVKKVFQHLKTHDIEDSSAFLLTFYEDGDSLLDIENEIENMDISKSFYRQFVNKENFQKMLLDYKRIKNELEDGNKTNPILKNSNGKVSLDSNNLSDIIADFKQTIGGLITCINKSQNIVPDRTKTASTQTHAQNILKDAKSQTARCIQKDAEIQMLQKEMKNMETQTELIEDRPTAASNNAYSESEVAKCLWSNHKVTPESSVKTKEQRLVGLEEEIRKMREELERIAAQDKKLANQILSSCRQEQSPMRLSDDMSIRVHKTPVIHIPKCVDLVGKETDNKLKTNGVIEVSTRKGMTGSPSPLSTPQGKNLYVSQDKVLSTRKTRESGRSLDIRKGKSESAINSPCDKKVARLSNESSSSRSCLIQFDTQIELRNHHIVSAVNNEQNQPVDDDLTEIKVEPIDKSDSLSLVRVNSECWCSALDSALFPAETKHKSTSAIKMLEQVFQNLKLCLGYFLPPEWPINKAAIRLLSPKELADFPLEKFFDKYKQGLRKLFTNFQSETAKSNEKLCNLRKSVLLVLQKFNKNTDIHSLLDDEIDKSLSDFINSRT